MKKQKTSANVTINRKMGQQSQEKAIAVEFKKYIFLDEQRQKSAVEKNNN